MESYITVGTSASKKPDGLELFDFDKILNKNQLNLLNSGRRLLHHEVIDITKDIGDHMFLNMGYVILLPNTFHFLADDFGRPQ